MTGRDARDPDQALQRALEIAGAEILRTTNPYEVMRFRTRFGVGIVYRNKTGQRRWNEAALQAKAHVESGKGWLAPTNAPKRKRDPAAYNALVARDGEDCFYCGLPLAGDRTIEHLVPHAHGGPSILANAFLAHNACNSQAGTLSAAQKIKLRDEMRSAAARGLAAGFTPRVVGGREAD